MQKVLQNFICRLLMDQHRTIEHSTHPRINEESVFWNILLKQQLLMANWRDFTSDLFALQKFNDNIFWCKTTNFTCTCCL